MGNTNSQNVDQASEVSSINPRYSSQSSDSSDSDPEFNIKTLNPGDFEVLIDEKMTKSLEETLELSINEVRQPLKPQLELKKDVIYPNGTYTGQFKGGKRHGIGIFQLGTGQKYHGHWAKDYPTGKGRLSIAEQEYYEGDFFKGRFFGKGVYKSSSYSYDGQWMNDKQEGVGIETLSVPQTEEREEYKGSFKNGLRHGQGTLTLINNSTKKVFYADFFNGSMQSAYLCIDGIDVQGVVVRNELRPLYIELHSKKIKIEFENYSNFQGKVYFEDNSFIYFRLDERSIESISLSQDSDN